MPTPRSCASLKNRPGAVARWRRKSYSGGWPESTATLPGRLLYETNCDALQFLGAKSCEYIVFDRVGNFDRMAADFAVLHIGLSPDRAIENHRNLFAAVRTRKKVLHASYPTEI